MESYGNYTLDMLIIKHREGDEGAFEELVGRFEPLLLKTARSLSLDVREVYSDACLSLRRAADTYVLGGEVTFGLYAKICVTRAMYDYAKRSGKDEPVADFDVEDVAVSDGVQRRLEREESLAEFNARVKELLSEYEYRVFTFIMRGYSAAEIADKLGENVKSVENAKLRIFKKLRQGIGQLPQL